MADHKSVLCRKRRHKDDSNPEKKLIDLNDDCLHKIFELLELEDLLNVANSNKWLNPAARLVFNKTHRQNRIVLRNLSKDFTIFYESRHQLLIGDLKTSFQFLRCFGCCITKLEVEYFGISSQNCVHINQYIQEYCATSLTEIRLFHAPEFLMNKSFPNMGSVSVVGGDLESDLPKFGKWFPELRRLKVFCNKNFHFVDRCFPHLEHLDISINNELQLESIATLVRLNHLQSLKIGFSSLSVTFSEFIRMIDIQPLITELTVWRGVTSLNLGQRNLDRFLNALPALIKLNLSDFKLTVDAAIACTRRFQFLQKFEFRLADDSLYEFLRQQLHDEWQMSSERGVFTLVRKNDSAEIHNNSFYSISFYSQTYFSYEDFV